ncbi:hypothetical protein ACJ41O_002939 [Fusarium nematophilum]
MATDPSSGPPRPADEPPIVPIVPVVPVAAAQHLARFEFSDAGTKVLMVEWYPDAVEAPAPSDDPSADPADSSSAPGTDDVSAAEPAPAAASGDKTSWQVSWPGKSTVLPAADPEPDSDPDSGQGHTSTASSSSRRRRVFFLLPADAPVPATITITPPGASGLTLKPLPAIFPPGLAADQGTRGVLHTLWARQRLAAIDREVAAELRANAEGVGVEMALAERQWILDTFIRPPQPPAESSSSPSPVATRSPIGRLGDKLKGLKLATSPADLTPSTAANTFTSPLSQSRPFHPQGADIAVSAGAAMTSNAPAGPISLNAALHGDVTAVAASAPVRLEPRDGEDDLFALPMSPRSPDMKKSPFSAL